MLDYKESPYIIAFILFLVISFGSKTYQEKYNDKKVSLELIWLLQLYYLV